MAYRLQKKQLWIRGLVLFVIAAAIFFLAGVLNRQHRERAMQASAFESYGTWLKLPKPIGAFSLESTQGGVFTNEDLKGRWTFVFFGYTRCPDICPATMKVLKAMYDQLKTDKISSLPVVIFISLDKQDSLEDMQTYVSAFDPDFIGLTGKPKAVGELAGQFGIAHQNMEDGRIMHNGAVTLVDPQGKIAAIFVSAKDPQKMAADYESAVKSVGN